jgi:ribosomal protein L22
MSQERPEDPEQGAAGEPADAEGTPEPSRAADAEPAAEVAPDAQGDADAEPAAEAGATPARAKRRRGRRAAKAKQGDDAPPPAEPAGAPAEPKPPAAGRRGAQEPAPKPEAKPPPAPRRPRKAGSRPRRRVVRAKARYVRTPARKARLVCAHLPGKSVAQARAILAFTPREVARDWSKLLESAVANAENNHELLEDDLIIREAYADEGPTIKRFRPRAMGRATPIRKRTSHLTITLSAGGDTTKHS